MAPPADAAPSSRRPGASSAVATVPISRGWKGWLLIGACFALGYGIPQRLVSIRMEPGLIGHQRFEVRTFPGTELESLRRRFGDSSMQIRGDLDLLELERQRSDDANAIEQRRNAMEQRENQQREDAAADAQQPGSPAEATAVPEPPVLPPPPEPEPSPAATPAAPPSGPGTTP
ncbi:MAG: hypothetical protein ACKO0M_02795 [Cyanobium sp.]